MSTSSHTYHYTADKLKEEEAQIRAAMEDTRKFGVLYDAYYLRIFRYIFQRVEDEDTAAEVTSLVFAKALQHLPKYQFRGVPFGAWLFRVAQNELNQLFRSRKARRFVNIQTERLGDLVEESGETFDEHQVEQLLEAIRTLKPHEVELIELRFFEKRSFREMGEILDLTENNAKVKTFRVVQKLKKVLGA